MTIASHADHVLERAAAAKLLARQSVEARLDELTRLSDELHRHPELAFEEHRAAALLADVLEADGFSVEFPAYGLDTAFVATIGTGELVVTLCAEYDALPGIGHACGHNLIAAISVGAGRALSHLCSVLGLTLRVLGTPAEERGGGKVLLLERGAFDGVGAAMMVHPAPIDALTVDANACVEIEIEFTARSGTLVDDAVVVFDVAVGLLRQHLPRGTKVHGVSTTRSKWEHCRLMRWQLRAEDLGGLVQLEERISDCARAAAVACDVAMSVRRAAPAYDALKVDLELIGFYRRNAEAIGRRFLPFPSPMISTDMGNVSQVVSVIHPAIGIGSYPAMNHTAGFADASVGAGAHQALRDGALCLSWTIIEVCLDDIVRARLIAQQKRGPSR